MLNGKRILLIVAGGIAAFKCHDLIRKLRGQGAARALRADRGRRAGS